MHEFRLADALRYSLPGAVLLLAALAVYRDLRPILRAGGLVEATILAGAALVIGSLIQTVHRALAYPPAYRIFLVWYVEQRRPSLQDLRSSYTPSATELRITEQRWRFAAKNAEIAGRLGDWGAQAHFLYATGWGVLLGALLPRFFGFVPNPRAFWLALGTCLLVMLAGFVHDRRLMLFDQRFTTAS